jgi:hypothetical protein
VLLLDFIPVFGISIKKQLMSTFSYAEQQRDGYASVFSTEKHKKYGLKFRHPSLIHYPF